MLTTLFNTAYSIVLEDDGIEPRAVATVALEVRRSITQLYLIHTRLDLIYIRPDLI